MTLSTYDLAIETFAPMLQSLSNWLGGAVPDGKDPINLSHARLAPDMYTLAEQVQMACHHALDAAARLMGQAPRQAETGEQTLDQLKAAIASTIDQLRAAPRGGVRGRGGSSDHLPGVGGAGIPDDRSAVPAPLRRAARQARLSEPGGRLYSPTRLETAATPRVRHNACCQITN